MKYSTTDDCQFDIRAYKLLVPQFLKKYAYLTLSFHITDYVLLDRSSITSPIPHVIRQIIQGWFSIDHHHVFGLACPHSAARPHRLPKSVSHLTKHTSCPDPAKVTALYHEISSAAFSKSSSLGRE